MLKSILIAGFFLLVLNLTSFVSAAQLGRTTGEVNFRERPSASAPVIRRLPAGADVQVLKRDPAGWYLVNYGGRWGFVHQNYVKLVQAQEFRSDLRRRAGAVCIFIGAALIALSFVPMLPRIAAVLILSLVAVFVLDLGFRLGILYSLLFVSLALLAVVFFVKCQTKERTNSSKEVPYEIKKAA